MASPTGSCRIVLEIWRDTDADRTGMIPFAFEDGMGFERYTDYALRYAYVFCLPGRRLS